MKPKEECGIVAGVLRNNHSNVLPYIKELLKFLQHRGQQSCGICFNSLINNEQFLLKDNGLVDEVLNDQDLISIKSNMAIGHVRYSTQGGLDKSCAQPFLIKHNDEFLSIAHNGNLPCAHKVRKLLEVTQNEVFKTQSDTEVILKVLINSMHSQKLSKLNLCHIAKELNSNFPNSAFNLVINCNGQIFALKDTFGFRPLFLCDSTQGVFIASEDCAFKKLDINKIIELHAGQGAIIDKNCNWSIKTYKTISSYQEKKCSFEHIYFANPASNVFGKNVYDTRVNLGKLLAKQMKKINFFNKIPDAVIIPVLNSGLPCALGFAMESKLNIEMGLAKNKGALRSFIEPSDSIRIKTILQKLNPIYSVLKNKHIIIVDDSLVRGTTAKQIIKMFKYCQTKSIHFAICSPMILNNCFFGVDISNKDELLALKYQNLQHLANCLNIDSINFLNLNLLKNFLGTNGYCYNCFLN